MCKACHRSSYSASFILDPALLDFDLVKPERVEDAFAECVNISHELLHVRKIRDEATHDKTVIDTKTIGALPAPGPLRAVQDGLLP